MSFFASAYNVPASGAQCVGSARLGLDGRGQRRGEVNLDMKVPTRGGGLCVGQPVEPVLTVDRAAKVHVYSVDASGAAYHIWPIEGADRVEGSIDLGQSWAVPGSNGNDETLVAIAVPAGLLTVVSFGLLSFLFLAPGLWFIYRMIKGLLRLNEGQPMPG